ncbi:hypothetical protein [Corynebacterium pacaense]|uniref:hypothetical protein n=1 Tax=Corynebacterium pacaense TaxID=1816684 RepID=UPI001FE42C50|nr:hypothetical protein [Corynebacterium pacaense]
MSTPSSNTPPASPPKHASGDKGTVGRRPEVVRLMLILWTVMVGLELVHQIINVIMSLLDPSELKAAARQQAAAEGLADNVVDSAAISSILLLGLFNLIIIGVLAWMLAMIARRSRMAVTARLMLTVFSLFFVLRSLMLFFAAPGGTAVPIAWYAVDGSLQILISVIGVLAVLMSRKPESVEWIGTREPLDRR